MTLPDFLIVGAQKSGTTALFDMLSSHPKIITPSRKELNFFSGPQRWRQGIEFYRSWFPSELASDEVTGEASPYYLFHPRAPMRAASVAPEAKIIILLRNPVDRAFSDYHDKFRGGYEHLGSFEQAIRVEPQRLAGEEELLQADGSYRSRNHRRYSYLARGVYLPQIQRWHEHFGWKNTLILSTDELKEKPLAIAQKVARFAGVKEETMKVHKGTNRGKYEPMKLETREILEDYFAPCNKKLYEYLGRDFGW